MKLCFRNKKIWFIVALIGLGVLLVWSLKEGLQESEKERERERPINVASRLSVKDGESIITVDKAAQVKSGITTAVLELSSHIEELKIQGFVLNIRGQDALIQITPPRHTKILTAPQIVWVKGIAGVRVSASLAQIKENTDIQAAGNNLYYLASKEKTGFFPGMNITVYFPYGSEIQGVVIPAKAVIWSEGKAWIYIAKDAEHFIHREVSTQTPTEGNWFIPDQKLIGKQVVVSGAQLLLSEEFRSLISVGEDKE